MARHHGRCPACGEVKDLTRHHLLPVRHHGRGNHNEHIVLFCQECHSDLEKTIPKHPVLPAWRYIALVALFIKRREKNAT